MFRNPRRDAASVGSVVRHWDVVDYKRWNITGAYHTASQNRRHLRVVLEYP